MGVLNEMSAAQIRSLNIMSLKHFQFWDLEGPEFWTTLLVELCGSNAAKEKSGSCTPCVEGLSCPTGSTVDMLKTAESMVQTKLVEGPKRVFEIYKNTKSTPQSSTVGRLKEIVLYSRFGQRSRGRLVHFFPWFLSDKVLQNWTDDMVKHPFSAWQFSLVH